MLEVDTVNPTTGNTLCRTTMVVLRDQQTLEVITAEQILLEYHSSPTATVVLQDQQMLEVDTVVLADSHHNILFLLPK